jgi:hypothetical protein
MKVRIATFRVAASAERYSQPGLHGSRGYLAPEFVGHLDCRVAHRADAEVMR